MTSNKAKMKLAIGPGTPIVMPNARSTYAMLAKMDVERLAYECKGQCDRARHRFCLPPGVHIGCLIMRSHPLHLLAHQQLSFRSVAQKWTIPIGKQAPTNLLKNSLRSQPIPSWSRPQRLARSANGCLDIQFWLDFSRWPRLPPSSGS